MDFPLPERPAGLKPRTCSNVKRCCGNGVPYYRDRRHLKSVRLLGSPSGKPDHMAVHRNPSDRNVFYLGKTEPVPVKVEGGICWGEEEKSFVLAKEREIELSQIELSALIKEGEKTRKKVILPRKLNAPVREGEKIGRVQYYIEDMLMGELSLYSDRSVKKMDILTAWGHVLSLWRI